MATRTLTDWDFWKGRILSQGETLAKDYGGNSLPISLKQIADARKVRNVIFRPLLVDGCLTVINDGFKIYVRCKKEQVNEARAQFDGEQEVGPLPQRMRFTLAHEIAHTLFYDVGGGRPKHRLNVEHHKRLSTLERVCNSAAARILLPTDLVRAELKSADPFEPHALRQLAEKAAVSGPMLVNRIGELSGSFNNIGGYAYAEQDGPNYRLKALRTHMAVRELFPKATLGCVVSDLVPDSDFVLNGGAEFERTISVSCRTNLSKFTQRFRFACERVEPQKNRRGVFVTFQRLDDSRA